MSKHFIAWLRIDLICEDPPLANEYWYRCTLRFIPYPGLTLASFDNCPVQRLTIDRVEYHVTERQFLCWCRPHCLDGKDAFNLVDELLGEVCRGKPLGE